MKLTTFNKTDIKARNIIVQCLTDNVLEMMKHKPSAKEVLKMLKNTYQKTGIATQYNCKENSKFLNIQERPS